MLQIEAKGGYGCVDGLGEALAEGSRNDGGAVIFERERDRSSSRPKICLSFAGAALAGQLTAQRGPSQPVEEIKSFAKLCEKFDETVTWSESSKDLEGLWKCYRLTSTPQLELESLTYDTCACVIIRVCRGARRQPL